MIEKVRINLLQKGGFSLAPSTLFPFCEDDEKLLTLMMLMVMIISDFSYTIIQSGHHVFRKKKKKGGKNFGNLNFHPQAGETLVLLSPNAPANVLVCQCQGLKTSERERQQHVRQGLN